MAQMPLKDSFAETLRERINNYFKENKISVKANREMKIKMFTGLLWWSLSYLFIYLFSFDKLSFFVLYVFHGWGHIFFSFNVGHDALHNAISKKGRINKLWAYSYDLLGVNTYMWRFMHHQGHHSCLNVTGEDMSLETAGFFRLSNKQELKPYHKYQHYYAFIIYGLYLLYYVFYKDFKYFFAKENLHLKDIKHPAKEWIILFVGKAFYLFYMLILPLLVLPFGWPFILFTFVFTLFMIGLVMSFTFQTTHIIDSTYFPKHNTEYENYVYHVFATTADYSVNNKVSNWFFGGLNIHIIHHLRPDICHTHYQKLTKILKEVAETYGVKYRENKTVYDAFQSHMTALKLLGNGTLDLKINNNLNYARFIKN